MSWFKVLRGSVTSKSKSYGKGRKIELTEEEAKYLLRDGMITRAEPPVTKTSKEQ